MCLHGLEQGLLSGHQSHQLLLLRGIADNGGEIVGHLLEFVMGFDISLKQ